MRALLLAALAGCGRWFGLDDPVLVDGGGSGSDAGTFCLGEREFEICIPNAPAQPLTLTATLSTDNCTIVNRDHGPPLCVMAGTSVTIAGDARAVGAMPLVIFAAGDLVVSGTLDVAGHHGMPAAAGADPPACGQPGDGTGLLNGGGGGAGGSFGSPGGAGGAGSSGNAPGGAPSAMTALTSVLRGGCRGGRGGTTGTAAEGGAGGGAVYLLAGGEMMIKGKINASGGGGGAGIASRGGGGGGGSGGMIALWSRALTVNGMVIANGGGGGGGADNGASGSPGEDPQSPLKEAAGGLPGGSVPCASGPGCGGDGAFRDRAAQGGGNDVTGAGGGGGGGGLGYVRVLSGQIVTSQMVSPPPVPE